jgi:ribosomal protein S12 methylthiotransferase accessory factor
MTGSSPRQRLLDALPDLIDEHVGIVRGVYHARRRADAPDFFRVYARACDTDAFCAQRNFGRAGGAAADRTDALAKAVGEAVERYCAAIYAAEDFAVTAGDAASCVAPAEFALYSAWQYRRPGFPYVPFTWKTRVRWVSARDLATGRTVNVPASMVFIPYVYSEADGEAPIAQPISTGLACHAGLDEAAASGICEVVERDAVTLTWQARISPPRIDSRSLNPPTADLVARFARVGYDTALFDITTDLRIPVVLAVIRGRGSESVPIAVAASAHGDPNTAARKALEEVEHTRALCDEIRRTGPPPIAHPGDVTNQLGHLQYWSDVRRRRHASFLFASSARTAIGDLPAVTGRSPKEIVRELTARLNAGGHRVLLCDLTTPDVKAAGLAVVRALVPGLHPLFMGYRVRALGGHRLLARLGHFARRGGGQDNPHPHPYP